MRKDGEEEMSKITAIIWAYNEEKRIENVIKALSGFDDIVVFDKSSTDRTSEIAKNCNARVVQVPYSDNAPTEEAKEMILKVMYENEDCEWFFAVVCSDIIHWKLYSEMQKAIDFAGNQVKVIEVPIYRYSMGICGDNSFFGNLKYQGNLYKRDALREVLSRSTIVHEDSFRECDKYRLVCDDPEVAVYHFTHENLEMVLERHERYARQYVVDCETNGKLRIQIMKYSWHEIVRTMWFFFRHRVFKMKWTGLAQCMMLIMYNAMIFLNAFFDDVKKAEIEEVYSEIKKNCMRENE